jgi:nucleotide-binding universal stress UspA family protein
MKLLIAFDGSPCSEAALDDLTLAGLPDKGTAQVVTVAEVWLPPRELADQNDETEFIKEMLASHRQRAKNQVKQAEILAKHAADRARRALPAWTVSSRASYSTPAWEIIRVADEIEADLIVVGSHGHGVFGPFALGNISQKVMTEAHCSVRIARGRVAVDSELPRILIGYDAHPGANAAVDAVAERNWPSGTEVRLVVATDSELPKDIDRFVSLTNNRNGVEVSPECRWVLKNAKAACRRLQDQGLKASTTLVEGDPKQVLVTEAKNWHADSIFLGATAKGFSLTRFLLGSTASAVAARAHSSVEIVRRRPTESEV